MMPTVNIEYDGHKQNRADFLKKLDLGMDDLIDFMFQVSQDLVAVDDATLKKSGFTVHNYLDKSITYAAGHSANIEYGTGLFTTRPGATKGRIYPKNSKALAWVLEGERPQSGDKEGWRAAIESGRGIIVKSMKGQVAQPYLRPAFDEGTMQASRIIKRRVNQ